MNALDRSLIELAGYKTGWENVQDSNSDQVTLTSARHDASAMIEQPATGEGWMVSFPGGPPSAEFDPLPAGIAPATSGYHATSEQALRSLLRRAAELARSLPDHAADLFARESANIDANPPSTTEALSLIKRRVGQDIFRKALLEYWGGACAVTGLALAPLLRASHAKPWASCESDQERLDVFNGFLLTAHLDALFDQGLMTFSADGKAEFSPTLETSHFRHLGLDPEHPPRLRWLRPSHEPYLEWHREHVFHASEPTGHSE